MSITIKRPQLKSTLQNPLLYANFVRRMQKIDPNFDPETIDRTLEYEEAEREARKRGYVRGSGTSTFDPMKEYRGYLDDQGIRHPRMQNFIMKQDKPVKQEQLDMIAYLFGARPHKNWKMDIKRKARTAKSVGQYAKNFNRYDIPGVDSPGSKFDIRWF